MFITLLYKFSVLYKKCVTDMGSMYYDKSAAYLHTTNT